MKKEGVDDNFSAETSPILYLSKMCFHVKSSKPWSTLIPPPLLRLLFSRRACGGRCRCSMMRWMPNQRARARPSPVPRRRRRRRRPRPCLSRVWSLDGEGVRTDERFFLSAPSFFPSKLSRKRGRTNGKSTCLLFLASQLLFCLHSAPQGGKKLPPVNLREHVTRQE